MTVSSDQVAKNDKREFVIENDTVRITYRFAGINTPVQLSIYNKTEASLEVNWKKSALIMNNQATSYFSPGITLQGITELDTIKRDRAIYGQAYGTGTRYLSDFKGNITVPEPVEVIFPRSSIERASVMVPVPFINGVGMESQPKQKIIMADDSRIIYRRLDFTASRSPVHFSSYLTFISGGKEVTLEHRFYVSELLQSGVSPHNFPAEITSRPDLVYASGSREAGY
jgi:hypothetical protein